MVISGTFFLITMGIGLVTGSASQWFGAYNSRKALERRHEYEKKVLENGHKQALEEYKKICEAQIDILKKEFEFRKHLLTAEYENEIQESAYLSSLGKWALRVTPSVLRGDLLMQGMIGSDDVPMNDVQPLLVLIAPSDDENFNKQILPKLNDNLDTYFNTYFNLSSSHPVLFGKDMWNSHIYVDSATIKGIADKIPNVPTLVLTPYIHESKLMFEMAHWCLAGKKENGEPIQSLQNNIIDFGVDFAFERGHNYSNDEVKMIVGQLTESLQMSISVLDDKYMWYRYLRAPQMLEVIRSCGMVVSDEAFDALYSDYVKMMIGSIESGGADPYVNQDDVLTCCINLDGTANKTDAFTAYVGCLPTPGEEIHITELDKLTSLPQFSLEFKAGMMNFCMKYSNYYGIGFQVISKLKQDFWIQKLLSDIQDNIEKEHDRGVFSIYDFEKKYSTFSQSDVHYKKMMDESHMPLVSTIYDSGKPAFMCSRERTSDAIFKCFLPFVVNMKWELRIECWRAVRSYKENVLFDIVSEVSGRTLEGSQLTNAEIVAVKTAALDEMRAAHMNDEYDNKCRDKWCNHDLSYTESDVQYYADEAAKGWVNWHLFGDNEIRRFLRDDDKTHLRCLSEKRFLQSMWLSLDEFVENSLNCKRPKYQGCSYEPDSEPYEPDIWAPYNM